MEETIAKMKPAQKPTELKKPPKPYPFNFVSRQEWGALEPTGKIEPIDHPIEYFGYKFSNTDPCISRTACLKNIKELQKYHMFAKDLPDIAYNFIVGGDLSIYEGRGWFLKPTYLDDKLREYDGKYLSIGYMGLEGAGIDRNFYCIEILDIRDDLILYGIEHGYLDENARYDRIDVWNQ
ncbi:peptidoglycan recognition protein 3-like [Macrosteles quadrilineatus]|uniref:peptidoglycan recognition protein 3-like n=1 Tax=Macrosteles quadrilineatus TaxID=74068 RepID=UPI0023E259FE|nr:peptidoglycan recognition protein 3-like [Macrosteles quadrilineatus]